MPKPRVPQFLVAHDSRGRLWVEALAILLWSRYPRGRGLRKPAAFLQCETRIGPPPHAFLSSAVFHFSVFFILLRVPFFLAFAGTESRPREPRVIYEVRKLDLTAYLPPLRPPGPGGKPGRGIKPDRPPPKGSSAFHAKLTLVSNPRLPDNWRQTIIQNLSPPEVRIPVEIRIPNLVLNAKMSPPRTPVPFRLKPPQPRSTASTQQASIQDAPAVPMALALPPSSDLFPKLAVPASPPPAPSTPAPPDGTNGAIGQAHTENGTSEAGSLIALSVEPAPLPDLINLPLGNRYGAFSVSLAGGRAGSPGGVPGGDPEGGTGGPGTGGNGSVGVGPAASGGGGNGTDTTPQGVVSTTGDTGAGGVAERGMLSGALIPSRVYPLLSPVSPRKSSFLIAAGPMGGGGLRIYGVLDCGKIYTSYLPMPGKSWVLQYCHNKEGTPHPAGTSRERRAELEATVIPPFAEERFDFSRPILPAEKRHAMIVLRGKIGQDGKVSDLRVLHGLQSELDLAALTAFSQWKFRPAMYRGGAVTVEVLVGIPAVPSEPER